MASRGSLSVLEPIPLNQLHDANPPPKKRKLSSASHDWAAENIIIRAHAASLSDDPYVLEPIAVISRLQLPFGWLDAPSALSHILSGSLFVANIPVLETDSQADPVVLVVRLTSDGGLCVIERVKRGIYALIKLIRGVEEGDVRVVVKASSHRVNTGFAPCTPRKHVDNASGSDWWQMAQVEDPAPDLSFGNPAKRAKVDFVFGVPDTGNRGDEPMKGMSPVDVMDRSSSCDIRMLSVPPETLDHVEPVVSNEVGEGQLQETTQSPQELLDGIREQYLQALYITKASVAYFAKGPLPRCRAAFQSADPGMGAASDLTAFYREAILTAKKMDLKFRETLPATLHEIVLTMSDDEAPKKRKSKKKTLGRNGLYAEELDFIRSWWKNRSLAETGTSAETPREAEIKKHVSDLRLRETQLQILLILETMALETAAAEDAKKPSHEEISNDTTPQKPKPKTKKPQDLNTMLELHLDRLCIWHTVSFDDVPADAQASGSAQQSGKAGGSDAMRDFCTEVIIPFYASRLPDRCKTITRKLGVSVSAISPFPKSAKKSSRKESGAVERGASQKQSRRTLQRVLTDEQTVSKGRSQPSLNRSITAPSQIESKRETTPLLPSLNTSVRGGIQKAKRTVENREVDLIAVARQHETKLKRVQMLADQKKELDAAILTLRKPNRELVAKDIAQDVEKRLTSSSSRKPKNPVRNPHGQGVQVTATPSKIRKRDAAVGLPLPKNAVRSKPKTSSASFSSPFSAEPQVIPGSVIRPPSFSGGTFTAEVAVQETPSRRPQQPLLSLNNSVEREVAVAESPIPGTGNLFRVPRRPAPRPAETDPSTPVRSQPIALAGTHIHMDMDTDANHPQTRLPPPPPPLFALPSKPTPSTKPSSMVFETPPKPRSAPDPALLSVSRRSSISGAGTTGRAAAASARVVPVTPEKSIYSALGWDDDDDDDDDPPM
ncbi:DNA replication regulator SLD3-domain-containing protein [Aspergillus pseudoustus]|uniref:DNA replication regulator SLD3-domain-containing protein n=1 Tax=Aspergillus pseudoustus TaxID=1810923 RepID=A0ABR4IY47_9EURO